MSATSSYHPRPTTGQPGGSQIVDENLNDIKAALDELAQAEPNLALVVSGKDYAATTDDRIILISAAATVTLADASKLRGSTVVVKNTTSAASVTVACSRQQLVDGSSSATLAALAAGRFLSDGASYWAV